MSRVAHVDEHEAFAFQLLRQGHPPTAELLARELRKRPGFLRMVENFRRIEARALGKIRTRGDR